jgi:hypothetical protein
MPGYSAKDVFAFASKADPARGVGLYFVFLLWCLSGASCTAVNPANPAELRVSRVPGGLECRRGGGSLRTMGGRVTAPRTGFRHPMLEL